MSSTRFRAVGDVHMQYTLLAKYSAKILRNISHNTVSQVLVGVIKKKKKKKKIETWNLQKKC